MIQLMAWHQAISWAINIILWHSFHGDAYLNTQDINPQVVFDILHINALVQDCSISITNALQILQSCTKPSTYGSGHGGAAVVLPGFAITW